MGLALFTLSPISIHISTQRWPLPARIGGAPTCMCLGLVFLCAVLVEVRGIWVMRLRVRLGVCMCEHMGGGMSIHTYMHVVMNLSVYVHVHA